MKESILNYIEEIDNILKKKEIDNLKEIIDTHLIKITFYLNLITLHLMDGNVMVKY